MNNLTKCGYCCDLCKAYAPNITLHDSRVELSEMWHKCYDLDIAPEKIYCDGCRCKKEDARLLDTECPVRKCVTDQNLIHCGECTRYPCSTFEQRKGLSVTEAKELLDKDFDLLQYDAYLLAFDNKTRLDDYRKRELK